MRFSCALCGQRYFSVDEPKPGHEYRVQCVACGAVVLFKGGDFPALPTAAADPRTGGGQRVGSHATTEEALGLALAPLATQQAGEPPQGVAARPSSRTAAPASRLWLRIAAGGAVALATAGAGLLLVFGGPPPAAPPVAPVEPPPVALPREVVPATSAGPLGSAPPDERRPPLARDQPPPRPPRAPPSPAKVAAPPAARRVASARRPAPPASVAPRAAARPAAPGSPAPASTRPPPDQMVSDALAARRPAFEACLRDWLRDKPSSAITGRQMDLLLMVNPNGSVSSPAVDDPAIDGTALGACLRGVVSRPFPPFEGEPLQVRMPLKLGE